MAVQAVSKSACQSVTQCIAPKNVYMGMWDSSFSMVILTTLPNVFQNLQILLCV